MHNYCDANYLQYIFEGEPTKSIKKLLPAVRYDVDDVYFPDAVKCPASIKF